jgi:hypothetical protein
MLKRQINELRDDFNDSVKLMVSSDMLNIIISESADFDDFKKKFKEYVKYMKKSNNNQELNYFKNILGLNLNLKEGSNIQMKANKTRKGVITSIKTGNNLNENITVRFNNNSTGKVKLRNIEKNNKSKNNSY